MSATVCYARNLPGHTAAVDALELPHVWLEAPLDARLAWAAEVPDWRDTACWPAGRLFGATAEYRWQMDSEGLHAVLLSDAPLPAFPADASLALELTDENAYLLWGEWIDPVQDPLGNPNGDLRFYAPEIPNILTYPLAREAIAQRNPCLIVRRYRHPERGEFIRCAGLELRSMQKDT